MVEPKTYYSSSFCYLVLLLLIYERIQKYCKFHGAPTVQREFHFSFLFLEYIIYSRAQETADKIKHQGIFHKDSHDK